MKKETTNVGDDLKACMSVLKIIFFIIKFPSISESTLKTCPSVHQVYVRKNMIFFSTDFYDL